MNEVKKTPFLHRKEYASSVRSKSEISRVCGSRESEKEKFNEFLAARYAKRWSRRKKALVKMENTQHVIDDEKGWSAKQECVEQKEFPRKPHICGIWKD